MAEAERLVAAKPPAEEVKREEAAPTEVEAAVGEAKAPEAPVEVGAAAEPAAPVEEVPAEVPSVTEPVAEEAPEEAEEEAEGEEELVPLRLLETPVVAGERQIRFAEDFFITRTGRPEGKSKKKKKKSAHAREGIKVKKGRRGADVADVDGA